MIPRPTFTADIPSIREADEINLSESLEMLKLKDVMEEENVSQLRSNGRDLVSSS